MARVRRQSGGAQVQADVRIVPAGQATPWGAPGTHTLFVNLAEVPGRMAGDRLGHRPLTGWSSAAAGNAGRSGAASRGAS